MYSFFAVVVSCWILYVDDPFFIFPEKVDCLMASVSCILAQVLNIPFSWRKHEFGPQVTWIGWQFHVTAGYISLHQNRIVKLSTDISFMQKSSKTSKKSLEKTVGLLNWVTHIFFLMRCWLTILYRNLYYIPSSHYNIDPGHWNHVMTCLTDNLQFMWQPTGTDIPVGSTLLAVRHSEVKCEADLHQISLPERRTWLRLGDPAPIGRS